MDDPTVRSSVAQRLCNHIKHWVLDHAHPIPTDLRLYPGKGGSIQRAIVQRVASAVDLPGLSVIDEGHPEGEARPCLWVGGDCSRGYGAVCRYLGRHWRLYPTTPESALVVDALLDRLASFAGPYECEADVSSEFSRTHLAVFARELDSTIDDPEGFLGGFGTPSIADLMWCASIAHVSNAVLKVAPPDALPEACTNLRAWCSRMMSAASHADVDEADGKEKML